MAHAARLPRRPCGQHEPAHGIGPVVVHQRDRLEDVAQVLAHLAAVVVEDVAQAQHGPVARLVEHERAHGHQGVEPPAGLVDRLADEVRRVLARELLCARVRVAPLGEGHRAAVVPAVDDLRDPCGRCGALRAGERHVVDVGAVRVQIGQVLPGQLAELGQRPDAGQVVLGAAPDRQRGAPVAVARQGPVDVVLQPVAVPAPLDGLRVPGGALVLPDQGVLDGGGPDVPGRLGVVDQRRVAAPAVRVGVLELLVAEQQSPGLEVGHQRGVGGLEEHPADHRHRRLERAVGPQRVDHRQAVRPARDEVLGAERRCLVDQAGAVLGRDVVGQDHVVRVGDLDEVERPGVPGPLQVATGHRGQDLVARGQLGLAQGLGDHDQLGVAQLAGHPDHLVGRVRLDRHRGVGHQGPGGGRPDQQARPRGSARPAGRWSPASGRRPTGRRRPRSPGPARGRTGRCRTGGSRGSPGGPGPAVPCRRSASATTTRSGRRTDPSSSRHRPCRPSSPCAR